MSTQALSTINNGSQESAAPSPSPQSTFGLTTTEQILLPHSPLRAPVPVSVSRVVTKETFQQAPTNETAAAADPNDVADDAGEHEDDLYGFDLLVGPIDERSENELLSLSPPPQDETTATVSFDSSAVATSSCANLLTPEASEAEDSSSASSPVPDPASKAPAVVSPPTAAPTALSIKAPPIVSVGPPPQVTVVSPRPRSTNQQLQPFRPRPNNAVVKTGAPAARSKRTTHTKASAKKLQGILAAAPSASAAAAPLPPSSTATTAAPVAAGPLPDQSSRSVLMQRLMPAGGVMDQQSQQPTAATAAAAAAPPQAAGPAPSSALVPPSATTTTTMPPQLRRPSATTSGGAPTLASIHPQQPQAAAPTTTATATMTGLPQSMSPPKKYATTVPAPSAAGVAYHHYHHQPPAASSAGGGPSSTTAGGPMPRAPPSSVARAQAPAPQQSNPNASAASASAAASQMENTGRWTAEEHRLFLHGLEQHGKGWKKIATLIKSRTVVQIRTHAQKYFQKLAKARQNGEPVAGVGMGTVDGTIVGGMMQNAGGAPQPGGGMGVEGDPIGVPVPVGADGQPVVTMRSSAHPGGPVPSGHPGLIPPGADPAAVAGASPRRGRGRRRAPAPGGASKRRAIGSVVRSAVREGRNVKRQKVAETKRNKGGVPAGAVAPAPAASSALAPSPQPSSMVASQQPSADQKVKDEANQIPNPLPAVSSVLDPYVVASMGMPSPAAYAAVQQAKNKGRGRQQMVHTATHGTLPMAALEDAVFRLLTPATGAPAAPVLGAHTHPAPAPVSGGAIVDPLAPAPANNGRPPLPATYHHHHPPHHSPAVAGQGHMVTVPNSSPTGVVDMSLLPSWVDAKNPPSWYNEGSDIDTLLEDAECLNWLSDTGDLEESYPAAPGEPMIVSSSGSATAMAASMPEPTPVVADPTGGVIHPSTESLSFLMDTVDHQVVNAHAHHSPVPGPVASPVEADEAGCLHSFLDDPMVPHDYAEHQEEMDVVPPYSSATEAVEATEDEEPQDDDHQDADASGLMGFHDLDMGDEQAFVNALLDNSGQGGSMSFPKLSSEAHLQLAVDGTFTSAGALCNEEEGAVMEAEAA